MGLFKSLKKLKLKNVVKGIAKVAPIVASVVPGVGPLISGAITLATKAANAANKLKQQAQSVTDVLHGGPAPSASSNINAVGPPGIPKWLIGIGALVLLFIVAKKAKVI